MRIKIGTLILLLVTSAIYFTNNPIVIESNRNDFCLNNNNLVLGKLFSPIGNNTITSVYIIISSSDVKELPKGLPSGKILYLNDQASLKEFSKHFEFIYTGSDMATCESSVHVFSGDQMILKSSISINSYNLGIQNSFSGWSTSNRSKELIEVFKKFKEYRYPILFCRSPEFY